ncbi:hypothetical protein BWI17_09140 [Betaproteobacteria bacterium GR16-43]|nr:hypothetical protein BWI17_09140 [Betaproteobacteria bacterium GR16-43]
MVEDAASVWYTAAVGLSLAFLASVLWVHRQGRSVGSVSAAIVGAALPIFRMHFRVRRERGSIPALDVIHLNAQELSGTTMVRLTPDEARELAGYLRDSLKVDLLERHPTGCVGAVRDYTVRAVPRRRSGRLVEIQVLGPTVTNDLGTPYECAPRRCRLTLSGAARLAGLLDQAARPEVR